MNFAASTTTAFGCRETIKGVICLSEGKFQEGAAQVMSGMTAINIGARSIDAADPNMHKNLMHKALIIGTGAVTIVGATETIEGIQARDIRGTIHGALLTTAGSISVFYLNCLDARIIAAVHQSLLLSQGSCSTCLSGLEDLYNLKSKIGALKLVMGLSGLILTGTYFINEIAEYLEEMPENKALPQELDAFIKQHEGEISEMYNKRIPGKWKELGAGVSKSAYMHPDTEFIFKIPHGKSFWGHGDSDVTVHFKNLKKAEILVQKNGWDHIRTPEAYHIQTPDGPMVVERKFNLLHSSFIFYQDNEIADTSLHQFNMFMDEGGYCDINLLSDHNAGFLQGTDGDIGIYDYDCKYINIMNNARSNLLDSVSIVVSAKKTAEYIMGTGKGMISEIGVVAGIAVAAVSIKPETLIIAANIALPWTTAGLCLHTIYQIVKGVFNGTVFKCRATDDIKPLSNSETSGISELYENDSSVAGAASELCESDPRSFS